MIIKYPRMIIKRHEYFINYRYVGDVSGFHTPYLSLPPLEIAIMIPCSWGSSLTSYTLHVEPLVLHHIISLPLGPPVGVYLLYSYKKQSW